jgi:hypothetical protein
MKRFLLLLIFTADTALGQLPATGRDPLTIDRANKRVDTSFKIPTGKSISLEAGATMHGAGRIFSLPQLPEAAEDTRAYVDRVSVAPLGDNGSTAATVGDEAAVRNAINAIYTYVGKSNLIDAWFLSTNHNVIGATTVPAFLSAANNGTKVGTPTFGADGGTFLAASSHGVKLPTGLNVTNFTDIVIYRHTVEAGGDGLMGNFGTDGATGYGGYYLGSRWSATAVSEYLGLRHSGAVSAGDVTILAKPDADRWATVAVSFVSGTQSIYLDGRYVKGGASTQAIDTTGGRQIAIGGWGFANAQIQGGFTGKIIFACKLAGTPSKEVMCRLCSALRLILQPSNGGINAVFMGDSRTGGTNLAGGVFTVDVDAADPQQDYWPNMLIAASNWAGKGTAFKCGVSGILARTLSLGGGYERMARQYGDGWQKAYLFWFAGINDFQTSGGSRTAQETYDRFAEVAAKARADGMIVVAMNQPKSTYAATLARITDYNALLLASPLWDYHVDVYNLLTPGGITNGALYDELHLTTAGNVALVNLINSTVIP